MVAERQLIVIEIYVDAENLNAVKRELTTRVNLALNIEKARRNLTVWEWQFV